MNEETTPVQQWLKDCVEAAKMSGTELKYEVSTSVDMESESTRLKVQFATASSSAGSLDIRTLLNQLEVGASVSILAIVAAPEVALVIQGAKATRNFEVMILASGSEADTVVLPT